MILIAIEEIKKAAGNDFPLFFYFEIKAFLEEKSTSG